MHEMSLNGILPGNDSAVHLSKVQAIIENKGVEYSAMWYPPLFHVFAAILLLFAGTSEVVVAGLMLKAIVATINVVILLSTYLLGRRLFGVGAACASAVFTIVSAPLFEMIFWGGYPNFLEIAYIALIFYTLNMKIKGRVKASLLSLFTVALVLTHQLSAFTFFVLFLPVFLVGSVRARKEILILLGVIVAGGLAALAWYSEMILQYSDILIYHVFFGVEQYAYRIPYVNLESFAKWFGVTLILALMGIPLAFFMFKRRKMLKVYSQLILWMAVPFFLSQSYLIGLYLPYERFVYFLATPIALFAGAAVLRLAEASSFLASKFFSKRTRRTSAPQAQRIVALTVLLVLIASQVFLSIQRFQAFSQTYEISGTAGYEVGNWLKEFSTSNGSGVISAKPGNWVQIVSGRSTIEETNPIYGRNAVAEAVLNQFYEIENGETLIREYVYAGANSGQAMYVLRYGLWKEVLSFTDSDVYVIYEDVTHNEVVVSLSETIKRTYWSLKSANEVQITSEYSHNFFTLEKLVTVNRESLMVHQTWRFKAHQTLVGVKLRVFNIIEPSLDFKVALVPGVLDWQNPWAKFSYIDPIGNWAVTDCPPYNLTDSVAAVLDEENKLLVAFEFVNQPAWFNVGALSNHLIDAVRIGYELGNLTSSESREVAFSVLVSSFQTSPLERLTISELKQILDSPSSQAPASIQTRDFLTYIEEYNVDFMVIDVDRFPYKVDLPPTLVLVYDNGKFAVCIIRR
jgi:hypothetical protein